MSQKRNKMTKRNNHVTAKNAISDTVVGVFHGFCYNVTLLRGFLKARKNIFFTEYSQYTNKFTRKSHEEK